MRVLLRLRKGDELRYLSHRDYMRAFELALRRAGLPVEYSEGFNPRPRMSFGTAVGVGVTSDDERIVLELASRVEASRVKDLLNSKLPAGMEVLEAQEVSKETKRSASIAQAGSLFRITVSCDGERDLETIGEEVRSLLGSEEIRVARERDGQVKEVNIRPGVMDAKVIGDGQVAHIEVRLRFGESGTRPHDLVHALEDRLPNLEFYRIHRLEQF